MLVMEWIDGIRCTDVEGLKSSGLDLQNFIRIGVVSGGRGGVGTLFWVGCWVGRWGGWGGDSVRVELLGACVDG